VRSGSVRASRDIRALAARLANAGGRPSTVRHFRDLFASAQPYLPDRYLPDPHPRLALPSS
jgi:hypothetical protein